MYSCNNIVDRRVPGCREDSEGALRGYWSYGDGIDFGEGVRQAAGTSECITEKKKGGGHDSGGWWWWTFLSWFPKRLPPRCPRPRAGYYEALADKVITTIRDD